MRRRNLENILKGIDLIREAVVSEMEEAIAPVETVEEKVVNTITEIKNEAPTTSEEVVEEVAEVETDANAEDLNSKTLKELKELAKEYGVSTKGSKSAIIGRILEAQENVEEVEEAVEETVDTNLTEEEVEEFEEATETLEEDNSLEAQLNEMTVEELADILAEVGISTKGKKQSLVAKVLKAIEEGKIELDVESDDEEEVVEDTVEDEVVEEATEETVEEDDEEGIDLDEILEELGTKELKTIAKDLGIKVVLKDKKASLIEKINGADLEQVLSVLVANGIIDATDIVETEDEEVEAEEEEFVVVGSDVRIEAVENKFAELMESIDNGEITLDEINEFFSIYFEDNKSELKKVEAMSDEDLANKYCWIQANLIDDDGEEVDFNEPYMVGDAPYCCGIPMKQISETTYVCEIDGEEVEIEE